MTEREDVRDLMARHNPVPAGQAVLSTEQEQRVLRRIRQPRRRRWVGVPLAVAALSLMVFVGVDLPITGSPVLTMVERNYREVSTGMPRLRAAVFGPAAAQLRELAALAERQPWTPRPANLLYSHTLREEWNLATTIGPAGESTVIVPTIVEQWTPVNGKDWYLRVERPGTPQIEGYRGVTPAVPFATLLPENQPRKVTSSMAPWSSRLPLEPAALRRALLATERGRKETARLVEAIVRLHEHDVVEPPLSAALWRVLSARPDLRDLGAVRDRLGRPGRAIGYDVDDSHIQVMVINTISGSLIATEEITLAPAGQSSVSGYRTFVRQGYM